MRKMSLIVIAFSVATLAVAVGGCGDDDDDVTFDAVVLPPDARTFDAPPTTFDAAPLTGLGASCDLSAPSCPASAPACVDIQGAPNEGQGYCTPSCGGATNGELDAGVEPAGDDTVCTAVAPAGWNTTPPTGCYLIGDTDTGVELSCAILCKDTTPRCPGELSCVDLGGVEACVR